MWWRRRLQPSSIHLIKDTGPCGFFGTDQDLPNCKQSSLFQQRCCNAYLINDLGGSSRTMKWALSACGLDSICVYVLPYHSIFLNTHFGKSSKCRLKPTQTATTSSMLCPRHGPIWPKLEQHIMLCRHGTTCWQHFDLSSNERWRNNQPARLDDERAAQWEDDERTRRREDKMTRRQDDKTTRRQDDKTTRQQDNKTTRRQDDKTTRRRDDETTRWHDDERVDKQMVLHQKGFPLIPRNAECIPFVLR